jgi:hypothetical protein
MGLIGAQNPPFGELKAGEIALAKGPWLLQLKQES